MSAETIPAFAATTNDCSFSNTTASTTTTTSTNIGNIAINRNSSTHFLRRKSKQKKLIIHVDIRNTIIVADSVTDINVEQGLNSYLTGVLWGREIGGKWSWVSEEPSLNQPEEGTMTYYKYLEKQLVKKPKDRTDLRMATGDFTMEEIGKRFRVYYDKHLEMLKWKFDDRHGDGKLDCNNNKNENVFDYKNDLGNFKNINTSSDYLKNFNSRYMIMTVKKESKIDMYHYILPSFIKLINHLVETGRHFSIIVRTYGLDSENVLSSIKYICQSGKHPNFKSKSKLIVRTSPGFITRNSKKPFVRLLVIRRNKKIKKGAKVLSKNISNFSKHLSATPVPNYDFKKYKYFAKKLKLYRELSKKLNTKIKKFESIEIINENDICHYFNESSGISGYVDDFIFWQNNSYNNSAGKPLWLVLPGMLTFDEFLDNVNFSQPSTKRTRRIYPGIEGTSDKNQSSATNGNYNTDGLASVETHHHIFFDDNIRVSDVDSIIDVRLYDKMKNTWRSLKLNETKSCEDVFLVQASLLDSIENENYFIDKVAMCEGNLEKLLTNLRRTM